MLDAVLKLRWRDHKSESVEWKGNFYQLLAQIVWVEIETQWKGEWHTKHLSPEGSLVKLGIKCPLSQRRCRGELVSGSHSEWGVPPVEPFGLEAGSHGSGGQLVQLLNGHVGCGVQGEVAIDLYQRGLMTGSLHIWQESRRLAVIRRGTNDAPHRRTHCRSLSLLLQRTSQSSWSEWTSLPYPQQ